MLISSSVLRLLFNYDLCKWLDKGHTFDLVYCASVYSLLPYCYFHFGLLDDADKQMFILELRNAD
jgi:hypothetical protein